MGKTNKKDSASATAPEKIKSITPVADATSPAADSSAESKAASLPEKPKTGSKEKEVNIQVHKSVLDGIFNDDPKGKYFTNDGETFLNESQFSEVKDKSGYQKFEK